MGLLTPDYVRQHGGSGARLTRVFFDGAKRTKNSALLIETKPLFQAKTFRDLVASAFEVKDRLEKDGLFEQVSVLIDVDKSPNPIENGYEVTFLGKEPQLKVGSFRFEVSNRGESSLTASGEGLNIFGSGEAALAEISKGSQSTTSLKFGLTKPLLKWRGSRVGLHVSRNYAQYPWSGFSNLDHCLAVDLTHEPVKKFIKHQIMYSVNWRHISLLGDWADPAPFSIRQYAGPSLKSSIQSTLTLDTRDDALLATRGVLLSFCNELAGANGILGGDVNFTRHEAHASIAAPLPLGLILALGAKATYVRPLGLPGAPDRPTLNIVDRTFLGGSSDLRGFEHNGVGPADDGRYLGGCASWCAALHLYKRLWPSFVFAHAFASAGSIASVDREGGAPLAVVRQLCNDEPRTSLGLGVVVKVTRRFRLEFNYCVPRGFTESDRARHGFQFGIGFQFI